MRDLSGPFLFGGFLRPKMEKRWKKRSNWIGQDNMVSASAGHERLKPGVAMILWGWRLIIRVHSMYSSIYLWYSCTDKRSTADNSDTLPCSPDMLYTFIDQKIGHRVHSLVHAVPFVLTM